MRIPRPQFRTDCLPDGERVFWSSEPMRFIDEDGEEYVIPANQISDGFSIPRGPLRAFFSVAPASLPAACLHDYLYSRGMAARHCLTRRGADRVFLKWLKIYGVGAVRRRLIYWGVRSGGWTAFNKQAAIFYQGDKS